MEIIKQGNPDKAFPVGHTFACPHCECEFKLGRYDNFDSCGIRSTEFVTKLVTVVCPNCYGDVTAKRTYRPVPSEVASPDGSMAVGFGYIGASASSLVEGEAISSPDR